MMRDEKFAPGSESNNNNRYCFVRSVDVSSNYNKHLLLMEELIIFFNAAVGL